MEHYKLRGIKPCPVVLFLDFVRELGIDAVDDGTSDRLEFANDKGSIYRIDFKNDRSIGFVSLDGTITAKPNRLQFDDIADFASFCFDNELGLRRGKVNIHGAGDLASDIFSSEAHRIASHWAFHSNG